MILTCPECATGYFVDEAKIGPGGRTVRCRNCGAQWRATADAPLDLDRDDPPAEPPGEALTEPLLEAPGNGLPKAYRARVRSAKQMRQAAVAGVVWAGLAAVLVAIVGGAVIFRVHMVRLWPRTAAAYAAVGLPVNPVGLVIERVHAQQVLRDGHAALAVSGVIRNVEDRAIDAPPLRITLLNADGHAVGGKLAVPTNARIPAGESRHFLVAVLDPPGSTANLMLAFDRHASPEAIRQALAEHLSADQPAGAAAASPGGLRGPSAPAPAAAAPEDLAATPAPTPGADLSAPPTGAQTDGPVGGPTTGSTTTTPLRATDDPPRPHVSAMMPSPLPSSAPQPTHPRGTTPPATPSGAPDAAPARIPPPATTEPSSG